MIRYERGDVVNGQFELLAPLSEEGGFGELFKARDLVKGDVHALKFLRDGGSLEDIQREPRPLLRLKHPHIVRGITWGLTPDKVWYLVTEFIAGRNLQRVVESDGPLSPDLLHTFGTQLLSAIHEILPNELRLGELSALDELSEEQYKELQSLQEAGLVHRDVKPLNVMVSERGAVLVDFGICSRAGTQMRTSSRTEDFMPPDFSEHAPAWWTADVDRYGVGATLYFAAHAVLPPWGRTGEPAKREDLPPMLDAFFERACAAREADRFRSTSDMVAAWDAIDWATSMSLTGSVAVERFESWRPKSRRHVESDDAARRLILEIVGAEGPVLCRRLYRLFGSAAGGAQLSRLNRLAYHMARSHSGGLRQVEPLGGGQQDKTVFVEGQDPHVLRTLGDRTMSELPDGELAAHLEAARGAMGLEEGSAFDTSEIIEVLVSQLAPSADEGGKATVARALTWRLRA